MKSKRAGMTAFLKAIGLGTLLLVLWGMGFWGAISPAAGMFKTLPNEPAVTKALGNLSTGTYFVPWPMNTPETRRAFRDRHVAGSFYQLSFVREGVDPESGRKMLLGVFHHLVAAVITVLLVVVSGAATRWRIFGTVVLSGSLGTVFATLGNPVWFHLPWPHALGRAGYELVAWILLGTVCARMLGGTSRR
jgi:hypothetical protein